MALALWISFFLVVGILVAVDIAISKRRPRAVTTGEAGVSTALWILAAVGFAYALSIAFRHDILGLAVILKGVSVQTDPAAAATEVWKQFFTAYITELGLSLDNIAVLAVIFARFHVRPEMQNRVFFWAIFAPILLRAALIGIGAEFINVPEVRWALASILTLAGLRTLMLPDSAFSFERSPAVRLALRLFGEAKDPGNVAANLPSLGHRAKTLPLSAVIAIAIASDLSLAIDSVPAALSVTRHPLIAICANTLAVLALRSLYFALAGIIGRFRFLNLGVAILLLGLAAKLAINRTDPQATLVTLIASAAVISISIAVSIPFSRRSGAARPTPLQDLSEAVVATRRNLKKVFILIGGTIVILAGILIAPLPGPGPTILIPLGLALLATEFLWARKLLNTLKDQTAALQQKADRIAQRTSIWVVPFVVVGFWAAAWAIVRYGPFKSPIVGWIAVGGLFIPVGYWCSRVILRSVRGKRPADEVAPSAPQSHPAATPPASSQNDAA